MPGWTTETADVVVFGIVPWTSRWQRPHHLARELVNRGHRVVYVTPHLLPDRQRWRELEEASCPDGIVLAQLSTFDLETIHGEHSWSADDVSHAHHTFWRVVDDLRLRCPILLVQSPSWWPLVSWIRERTDFPLVYDCLDEHTGWNEAQATDVRAREEELARAADLVLASAPPLAERMQALAGEVVQVPNGCDFEHFAAASEPNGVLRPPLDGPIVGYYGAISAGWFDTGLVVTLAESRPDWNIVLIGPVDAETRVLLDPSPNIVQLGSVPYAELPRYCADFDVATIPFLVNELTRATDPVKLYEYFAAGKPVVTTPLPSVYEHQGPLAVADTPGAFERAIEAFLAAPGDPDERREIARAASWEHRVDLFYERMLACLPSLDVVVLTHNGVELTRRCLASLEEDKSYPHHLIVVDNASTDATTALLDEVETRAHATVIRSETNAGFSAGLNHGIQAGDGRYVLVLNNDTELPQGGLLAFVNALSRSREVGLVGPVTNSIGNEAEIYAPYRVGQKHELDAWFGELAYTRFGMHFDLASAALFAAIARREDLEAIGGLAERYQVGMFEDDELAERIRRLGKRVVCAEDTFVHHAGRAAFRTLDPVVYQAIFDRNRRVFESTIGRPWKPHAARLDKRRPVETRDEGARPSPDPSSARCLEGSPRPSLSYFVCGSNRSGTNLLCALLESSGVAGRPSEYFWKGDVEGNRRAWDVASPGQYLAEVVRRSMTSNGVFGVKLMRHYLEDFMGMLRIVSRDPSITDGELLDGWFPYRRFVWMWRDDVVAQAVSWAKADQTGQWTHWDRRQAEPEFEFASIDARVRQALVDWARWKEWFARHDITPLVATYEELVADQVGVTVRVLHHLGLALPPQARIDASGWKKQSDFLNDEWISRYRELAGLAPGEQPAFS